MSDAHKPHLTFQADLQGRQLAEVDRELDTIGEITNEQALALLDDDGKEFRKYLHFTSIRYLKRMAEPKNEDLRNILEMEDEDEQVKAFNQYIGDQESLKTVSEDISCRRHDVYFRA